MKNLFGPFVSHLAIWVRSLSVIWLVCRSSPYLTHDLTWYYIVNIVLCVIPNWKLFVLFPIIRLFVRFFINTWAWSHMILYCKYSIVCNPKSIVILIQYCLYFSFSAFNAFQIHDSLLRVYVDQFVVIVCLEYDMMKKYSKQCRYFYMFFFVSWLFRVLVL